MLDVENRLSLVSIIIPCRNEKIYIGKCLDSIIAQDYPKDKMEILVVDGMSEDGSREIVKKLKMKNEKLKVRGIRLLDNPKKIVSSAMNIGIKEAKGDVIIRALFVQERVSGLDM